MKRTTPKRGPIFSKEKTENIRKVMGIIIMVVACLLMCWISVSSGTYHLEPGEEYLKSYSVVPFIGLEIPIGAIAFRVISFFVIMGISVVGAFIAYSSNDDVESAVGILISWTAIFGIACNLSLLLLDPYNVKKGDALLTEMFSEDNGYTSTPSSLEPGNYKKFGVFLGELEGNDKGKNADAYPNLKTAFSESNPNSDRLYKVVEKDNHYYLVGASNDADSTKQVKNYGELSSEQVKELTKLLKDSL